MSLHYANLLFCGHTSGKLETNALTLITSSQVIPPTQKQNDVLIHDRSS